MEDLPKDPKTGELPKCPIYMVGGRAMISEAISYRSSNASKYVSGLGKSSIQTTITIALIVCLGIVISGRAFAQQGPELFSLSRFGATLYTIDRESGGSLSSVAITLPGEIIQGGRGFATSPVTEELFAVLSVDDAGGEFIIRRLLTTIDPVSGMATKISDNKVGKAAALAFDNSGTLYIGESANEGAGENRLHVLDTVTGERTEFMQIANSEGGIALALNPLDGQIYHLSGSIIFDENVGTPVFEKIDTTSMTRTAIPLSGVDVGHVRAMTLAPDGNFLVVYTLNQYGPSSTSGRFLRLTPDGVATHLGPMDHIAKGVAFVTPITRPEDVPDLSFLLRYILD